MPKPFVPLTLAQFREALRQFNFSRQINAVHMHHTFRPNHAQFRGLASIEAMFEFHTRERKFSDIAQHITIAPDGTIFTGRNWNQPPASATGHNGNSAFGPFMFETVGDFDTGRDAFEDPQRETVLQVIAAVQQRFGLPPDALRFHSEMANKSCPGQSLHRPEIIEAVTARHTATRATRSIDPDAPFAPGFQDDSLTGVDRAAVRSALETLMQPVSGVEPADAEVPESDVVFTSRGSMASAAARGVEVTETDLVALRPHVIDLNEGMLTEGGIFSSLPEDVDRIFGEDMERAFTDPASAGMPARADGEPFRVILWAHGGLIGERQGLAIAHKHLAFWKANGVYPLYFVWETGLFQTIGQLLRGIIPGSRDARNLFSDNVSDPILERTARAAGGEKIWSGMKRNAELAATPAGGATKAAKELKKFCDRHPAIELHAAGHSAGAIFHSLFLPRAFAAGVPDVASLHLLAPAIRVDSFTERLLGLLGTRIKRTSLYTMVKEKERDDNCAEIYRKSLLYLIRFALERESDAEILGLEECLRRDRAVASAFGLGGTSRTAAEAIFSPSMATDGPSATQSLSHGGFDDDGPTMNSVALRILGLSEKSKLRQQYPSGSRDLAGDVWIVPEVAALQRSFASAVLPGVRPAPALSGLAGPSIAATPAVLVAPAPVVNTAPVMLSGTGRRRALCIGIDRYPIRPLAGCVADAKLWARTLQGQGFECDLLLDGDATYDNIKAQLQQLLITGQSGDVIVWQYSGHGTQVPDVNGDEAGGDSPGQDEAICPVDLQSGRFLIDDEIGALIDTLRPGVQFTMFIDCCHSGTLNRFGFGEPPSASSFRDERARFMPLTADLKAAYLQFAGERRGSRALAVSRSRSDVDQRSEVLFSACLSSELAWESNGQGEFTLRATTLLGERGVGATNEAFMNEVIAAFGSNPRQTPNLTCAASQRTRGVLQPLVGGSPVVAVPSAANRGTAGPDGRFAGVAGALDALARQLREL